MKAIIRTSLFVMAMFACTQMHAQTVTSYIPTTGTTTVSDLQDFNYYQGFSYYNNPEINKLENEVTRHGNLFRWDQYGNKKYSATRYRDLTESEKKDFRSSSSSYNRGYVAYSEKDTDDDKDKTADQRAEEYFSKMIAPYLNSDGTVNKQKLHDEIKKDLNTLFEMKEAEKQKEVTKLENKLKSLQGVLADRKKNKQEIIDQRMNELVGLPNTLKW
jgi:hypothetical protein